MLDSILGLWFLLLWSDLVLWVGASHKVNLIATFPLGQNCLRKIMLYWNVHCTYLKTLTPKNVFLLAEYDTSMQDKHCILTIYFKWYVIN